MALHDASPALQLLVGARSKEVLTRVLQDAYDGRVQGFTRDRRRRLCEELTLPDDAAACAVRHPYRVLARSRRHPSCADPSAAARSW